MGTKLINRGEISKIFGELFFSIDPRYRGVAGEVFTKDVTKKQIILQSVNDFYRWSNVMGFL